MFLLILTSIALANDGDPSEGGGKKVVYRSETTIDFEELEIEGVLQRPQSQLILERKKASFNPLIKLRTDWDDKLEESVDEVK
jgi:hypothetical protein